MSARDHIIATNRTLSFGQRTAHSRAGFRDSRSAVTVVVVVQIFWVAVILVVLFVAIVFDDVHQLLGHLVADVTVRQVRLVVLDILGRQNVVIPIQVGDVVNS